MEKKSESSFAQVKSKIKVVFLGQQSTGKTSILMRFIHDKFQEGLGPTIGIDFMAKNLHIGHNILRMQLWDTAGQERFRSLIPSYLKDALIVFVVFDLTNEKSFANLNEWIDLCQNNKKDKSILVLLGNKADLKDAREVSPERIRLKIEESNLPYFEVSAKNGQNIKEALSFAGNQYFTLHLNSSELTFSNYGPEKMRHQVIMEQKMETSDVRGFKKQNKKQISQDKTKNASKQNIILKGEQKKRQVSKKRWC